MANTDQALIDFLGSIPNHKTTILQGVPTAENLAKIAFELLAPVFQEKYGKSLRLKQLRLYETPNCWADVIDDVK